MRYRHFLLLPLFGAGAALACSLAFAPLSRPSPSEIVFVGRVVTIRTIEDGAPLQGSAVLTVRVEDLVSGSTPSAVVDVAVLQLMADCSTTPIDASILELRFPVGAQVTVLAKRAASGADLLLVEQGGLTEFSLASSGPSDRLMVRRALAQLARKPPESVCVTILTGLITDSSGELDFEAAVKRYIRSPAHRSQLLQAYRSHRATYP